MHDDPERPWLSLYPAGIPHRHAASTPHLLDHWDRAVAHDPGATAIRYFDAGLSFAELDARARGLAGWFARCGVSAGHRVAIVLQNVPDFTVAVIAAWKLGAVPVPCNPMYRRRELAELFHDFAPGAIVCQADQCADVAAAAADAGLAPALVTTDPGADAAADPRVVAAGDHQATMAACRRQGMDVDLPAPARHADDPALILYTSGTTGRPKGVVIPQRALVFNAEVAVRWMELDAGSRILGLAPYFHITGFVLHMAVSIVARCPVGLTYRFHPEATLAFQRAFRATTTVAAVTAFNAFAAVKGVEAADFDGLTGAFSGGAPIAPALREELRRRLGVTLTPVYGMTETCSPTHIAPRGREVPVDPDTGALSVGVPISSTEMRIVGSNGLDVALGDPGEVWLRGPQVMSGYWRRGDETAEVLTPDGWLRSGDVGVMDAGGWLYVVDRQKDMINASGFKVWPRQVEDALMEHRAVREAAVVGEPDAYRGETVAAYVALRPGEYADSAVLEAHCRARLAAYKVPRSFTILDEIPKTATGKIRRAALRD